ncbi:MAG: hypothetical protein HY765_08410 [Rhodomicrobium sp.]|nr:hypothetical protein [Rhodomicrobium sp.]
MFGAILRLMAAAEAGRRMGDYMRLLARRYLVLSAAVIPFAAAAIFAILAIFWALNSWIENPVWPALIMVGILALAGFSIVYIAYGITREKPQSVRQAIEEPLQAVQSHIPTVEDVGRQIEHAVHRYGPVRVAAAAAAGGLVAGLLARRLGQTRMHHMRMQERAGNRRNFRRYAGFSPR